MSWSVSSEPHKAEDIRSAVEHMQPSAELSDAQTEQVRVAKEAAIQLLNNGAVGSANALEAGDGYFKVHLTGHGTDEHGAGDHVQVRIEKVSPPA